MSILEFYERYWRRQGGSPAERGFALTERQTKLRKALAELPAGASVLDAGCGKGDFSFFLAQLGYHVIGVDISSAAVAKAKAIAPACRFEVASLEASLPFGGGGVYGSVVFGGVGAFA